MKLFVLFTTAVYTFSRFDRIPACDRQPDGHQVTALSALCIASRGKNGQTIRKIFKQWRYYCMQREKLTHSGRQNVTIWQQNNMATCFSYRAEVHAVQHPQ